MSGPPKTAFTSNKRWIASVSLTAGLTAATLGLTLSPARLLFEYVASKRVVTRLLPDFVVTLTATPV